MPLHMHNRTIIKGAAATILSFVAILLLALVLGLAFSKDAAAMDRPAVAWRLFQKYHPCPSTGKKVGPCPGWYMQYKKPLAQGGDIAPYNLKWVQRS